MNILLLGGSNAGVRNGWADQYARSAPEHHVENRFLGAVGSLYGLMALLKMEREGSSPPDLVVFEYCLNDILLIVGGVSAHALIADALDAVIDFCAQRRVGLIFLCLEPRPVEARRTRRAATRVKRLYASAARRSGARCLWLTEILDEPPTPAQFQDENHLMTEAAGRVAQALRAAIDSGVRTPSPLPGAATRFDYVDATQCVAQGSSVLQTLSSRVFDGGFLEISRGGKSFWPGDGVLAALMLRSNERSGAYSIRADNVSLRKTARSQMQEIVRNLMLLHYVSRRIYARGGIEIAMPEDEETLMRLPEDPSLLAAPTVTPFDAQTLDIHGVIFWRPRSWLARLREFLRFG